MQGALNGLMPQMGAIMSDILIDKTSEEQRRASNPAISVWATANAGAGKTKVLIDRIARVLLQGAQPSKILAVTYTKAAAAEMTTRLFKTLGKWTIDSDEDLSKALKELDPTLEINSNVLKKARALFANALETPGGLKVQTIHAFCGDVLKRFPIEAGVAPGFETADEVMAGAIMDEAFDRANAKNLPLYSAIAAITHGDKNKELLAKCINKLGRNFEFKRDELTQIFTQKFGIDISQDVDAAITDAVLSIPKIKLRECANILLGGKSTDENTANTIIEALESTPQFAFDCFLSLILTQAGEIKKSSPVTKQFQNNALIDEIFGCSSGEWPAGVFADFFETAKQIETLKFCQNTLNLIEASSAWQSEYKALKNQYGLLDFDDLLAITSNLLNRNQGSALWVMYKLDKGLSHVLIDESQDTSAEQWDLLHPLLETLESTSSDEIRTQFVVGDDKQSIYRFQGASPQRYDEERKRFIGKNEIYQGQFQEVQFDVSFRTGEEILKAVDIIWHTGFGNPSGDFPLELEKKYLWPQSHFSARSKEAAITELWPLILGDKKEKIEREAYDFPLDAENEEDAKSKLAELIARQIALRIKNGDKVWTKDESGKPVLRPCKPADFMILVKGRSSLYHRIIKRLKKHKVKVAGADLIILKKEPAILDLLAAAQFALCNNDDFNLACLLKSCFCNLYDDDKHLFPIAYNRGFKSVLRMIEESEDKIYSKAKVFLDKVKNIGAHIPPYDFFAKILETKIDGENTGWDLLLKRFGEEAREPIEIFLDLALNASNINTPNLHLFIDYIENKAQSVKREFDQNDDGVKVMTIHGSKGREAPIVILPDTTRAAKSDNDNLYYDSETKIPFWTQNCAFKTDFIKTLNEQEKAKQAQEDQRLLYVAMTRPRDRLILCGHQSGSAKKGYGDNCWYDYFERNLNANQNSQDLMLDDNQTIGKIWGKLPDGPIAKPKAQIINQEITIPDWVYKPIDKNAINQRRIAPSILIDENYEPPAISPISGNKISRFLRGTLIHELLETLPQIEKSRQIEQAQKRLARENQIDDELKADIINEALKIINDDQFGDLFSQDSRAEVAIMGKSKLLPNDMIINGMIDRMIIKQDEILVLDYKTNRPPPKNITDAAPQYINQMACYWALLQETYPKHRIKCALLWTDVPDLMEIPQDLMKEALAKLK